jgi:hypothetical protein
VSDGRNYTAGTKEALFMLSRGHCYEPSCKARVIQWTGSTWIPVVAVAHICGLRKGSRRHDENMSERQRNNFRNLILLCKKHHDLVDGEHTWMNYPVSLLIEWKTAREGDLASELDQLDWITPDKLQELMADAIEETLNKILGAIDGISTISRETLRILKALVGETLKLPYLNPEDIESLEYCAEVFEILPEYVPALFESARSLRDVSEYSEILYQAAKKLDHLADSADMLSYATRPLKNLGEHVPQLLEATRIISGQSIYSYQDGISEINAAADKITQSASSLSRLVASVSQRAAYPETTITTIKSPAGPWSWKAFWWGVSLCMVFVVTILSLWAYATAHRAARADIHAAILERAPIAASIRHAPAASTP